MSKLTNQPQNSTLRTLTLNCWGLPLISKDLDARMLAIGEAIASMNLDVVGLQEVYREQDRQVIRSQVEPAGLVYNRYFPSRFLGSGLFLLSRYPIQESGFVPYSLNGRPQDLVHSDYYAGKGFGWGVIDSPGGQLVAYNTHMIAPYLEIGDDVFSAHRVGQATELMQHMELQSLPVLLLADLNNTPDRIVYRMLRDIGQLRDSFAECNPGAPGITVTTDIPYLKVHEPERIDYILYRNNSASPQIEVAESEVVFNQLPESLQDQMLAYSDHYGVQSTFQWVPAQISPSAAQPADSIYAEARAALQAGFEAAGERTQQVWLQTAALAAMVMAASMGSRAEPVSRRTFLRLLLIFVTLLLAAGMGVSFSLALRLPKEQKAYQQVLDKLNSLELSQAG